MSTAQNDADSDSINKLVEYLKKTFKNANEFFDKKGITTAIGKIEGIGYLVTGFVKMAPGPESEVVKSLRKLGGEIRKLDKQMVNEFQEMKKFITEMKIFIKVISPVSILMEYVRDCINHPTQEAVDNFRKAYQKNSPLKILYTLLNFLEQRTKNPIRVAIESDSEHKTEHFKQWDNTITRALEHLILLESFATGLFDPDCKDNCNLVVEEAYKALDMMVKIRKDFTDEGWDEIKDYLEDYLFSPSSDLSLAKQADEIAAYIETIPSEYAYYILVFKKYLGEPKSFYGYSCVNEAEQVIALENGQTRFIIYRSRKGNLMDEKEYDLRKKEVEECNKAKIPLNDDYRMTIIFGVRQFIRHDGLIFLGADNTELAVQTAHCPAHKSGPGWFQKIDVNSKDSPANAYLLVAFP